MMNTHIDTVEQTLIILVPWLNSWAVGGLRGEGAASGKHFHIESIVKHNKVSQ